MYNSNKFTINLFSCTSVHVKSRDFYKTLRKGSRINMVFKEVCLIIMPEYKCVEINNNGKLFKVWCDGFNIEVSPSDSATYEEALFSRHYYSSGKVNFETVKYLCNKPNFNINYIHSRYKEPILAFAVYRQSINLVKYLCNLPGINVNLKSYKGNTPLHCAIEISHYKIIKYLCSVPNININIKNDEGMTPLHCACDKKKNSGIIEYLCDQPGIDINPRCRFGKTPLHYACSRRNFEAVKLLFSKPNIDLGNCMKGYSPLYYACKGGCIKTIKFLLENGCDFGPQSVNFGEVIMFSRNAIQEVKNVIQLLVDYGQDIEINNWGSEMFRCREDALEAYNEILKADANNLRQALNRAIV